MKDIQKLISEEADFICRHQLPSGAIPWYERGIADPWDEVECAIALDLSGRSGEAAKAYRWMRDIQNADGSWYFGYLDAQPQNLTKDTNYSSYIATGIWYHYLFTKDLDFLRQMWNTIDRAIAFTLRLQQPTGEIYWACDVNDKAWPGALLGASSCIWRSIRNGMRIAKLLGIEKPDWELAGRRLAKAIREQPELFDKFGENKQGFATNWFYPVLTGVIEGKEAKEHILRHWGEFVIDSWGCRCVRNAPWVTVAETCELIMALCRIGEVDSARLLLDWILRLKDNNGGFWSGIKLPEQLIWPEEKNTWTSAAVIIAALAQAEGGAID
jgi:hypothetical protein